MSAPEVTVGIPTFNRAGLLKEAIESVLAQTFSNFCLIVSDNASDDDTPDLVRSYSDRRIDYVRSERNIGAIGNINRLIALAETEFLVILTDDDVLYPGHLEATLELLNRVENLGLAHTAYERIDAQSRVITRVDPVACQSPVAIERRDRAMERLMVCNDFLCFPSVAYRTKALVESGGFREELGPFCDRELWMRMALAWDFGYVAKPLVGQRAHAGTVTVNLAGQQGVASDERERFRLYAQMNFQQRGDFLDNARMEPGTTNQLRSLARLQLLIDNANAGLPFSEVASGLADVVRAHPRIVLRSALWRLVAAQLGGRRVRSALRAASTLRRRPGNRVAKIVSAGGPTDSSSTPLGRP
jgi:glycosyltransferase involved in cell wall biosynthesis